MYLMNGNMAALQFSLDDLYIKVIDNQFLPYGLKDYITDSSIENPTEIKKTMRNITVLKDYLCSRTLSLSRDNVKAILHTLAFPQSLKTDDLLKIVFTCDGLSMTDNIWIKEENDNRTFEQVNLRNHHLGEAAYNISILGETISATKEIMQPDLGTNGMFAKTWVRTDEGIYLWKTDKLTDCTNTVCEIEASNILDKTNVPHVHYDVFERDDKIIASCKCIATDDVSIINGYELKDWCVHTGRDFIDYIEENFLEDFSKMCVADYMLANTDRHLGNINFYVNNHDNSIVGMAPLIDHNQSLIVDKMNNELEDSLIYEATNLSIFDTAIKYYKSSNIVVDIENIPIECRRRLEKATWGVSMIDAKGYSQFMGLTDSEVESICKKYNADYTRINDKKHP